MLSTFNCWAVMPLAALYKARIISLLLYIPLCWYPRYFIDSILLHIRRERDSPLQHVELSQDADQLHGRGRSVDIRGFDLSLVYFDVGGLDRRLRSIRELKIVVPALLQHRRIGEIGQIQIADRGALLLNASVRRHFDRHRWVRCNRPTALRAYRISIGGNKDTRP